MSLSIKDNYIHLLKNKKNGEIENIKTTPTEFQQKL